MICFLYHLSLILRVCDVPKVILVKYHIERAWNLLGEQSLLWTYSAGRTVSDEVRFDEYKVSKCVNEVTLSKE